MKSTPVGGMTGNQMHSEFKYRWSQKYDVTFLIFVSNTYLGLTDVVWQSLMHLSSWQWCHGKRLYRAYSRKGIWMLVQYHANTLAVASSVLKRNFLLGVGMAKTCKKKTSVSLIRNSSIKKCSKEICTLLIVSWLYIITGRIPFLIKVAEDTASQVSFILLKIPELILMLPLKQRCPKPSAYKILSVSRFFLGNQKNHQQQQKWKERPREKPLQGAGAAATTQPQWLVLYCRKQELANFRDLFCSDRDTHPWAVRACAVKKTA